MNRYSSVPILKRSNLTTCLRVSPEKSINSQVGLQLIKSSTSIRSKLESQFTKYFERRVYYSEMKQRPSNPIFSSKNKHEIAHSPRRCISHEPNRPSASNLRQRKDFVVNNLLSKNSSRASPTVMSSTKEIKLKTNKVLMSLQPRGSIKFQLKCYSRDFNLFSDVQGVDSFKSNNAPNSVNHTNIQRHLPKFESFSSNFIVDIKEMRRKRMTCIRHLLQLKPTQKEIYHLKELMPDKSFSHSKSNDFLRACKAGIISLLKYLIAIDRWVVHVYDNSGENGLHWACKRDSFDVVKLLISAGCFVDSRDFAGRTPLYIAGRYNAMGCARLLLNHKASVSLSTYSGRSILDAMKQSTMKSLVKRFHTDKVKSNSTKAVQDNHEIKTTLYN